MSSFDDNWKVAAHVHQSNLNMEFKNVWVVGLEANYHQRRFLEAWHSTEDPNAGTITSKSRKHINVKVFKSNVLVTCASLALRFSFLFK